VKQNKMESGKGITTPPGSSHSNPAPIGITVKTTVERGDSYSGAELCDLGITVLEVVRGKEAWERIKAQGVSKKPAKAGFEYLLARIRFFYSRRGSGFEESGTYSVSEGQFIIASADGMKEYEPPPVLKQPEPGLIDLPLHPDETREGWVVLQVPEKDKLALLVFKRQHVEAIYGLRGYVWFKLH
jgi:hypothetical protein